MICFIRIDNRLIHGQVVQSWLPKIKADKVVVVSEQASENILMQKMMRVALPQGYALKICPVKEVLAELKQEENKKIFLLIEDLYQLLDLAEQGLAPQNINVGNTKYEEDKKEFSTGVYFNKMDLDIINKLQKQGFAFIIQALPSSLEVKINA